MNWIILLFAGLFEVSLTFCLGKARAASGIWFYLWGSGFLASTILNIRFQGTSHSHQAFLPLHAHCFLDWIEDCVILKKRGEK